MPDSVGTGRQVRSLEEEGPLFSFVLHAVADFYVNTMKGQVRHDADGVLVKWSRDWEYPWLLMRASVKPGDRVLDCGSGFSPVPFLLSRMGAQVWAVDRDVVVCSRLRYATRCAKRWIAETAGLIRRVPGGGTTPKKAGAAEPTVPAKQQDRARRHGLLTGTARFLVHHLVEKHRKNFRRIWRPDFWGPVSPRLIRQFGVHYVRGDLTHLPFPDAHADLVTCVSVLEHLSGQAQRQSLEEMARVLRPGGTLLLTYDQEPNDPIPALAAAAGFRLLEFAYRDAPAGSAQSLSDVAAARLVTAPPRA